jgi:hypothetical protein
VDLTKAERAVQDIELTIGGQRIDKHYQKWWRLYSELFMDSDKKANYQKMTSYGKAYLPLLFFFNRNPGLYLPLIALQYHEVRLDIDLSSEFETVVSNNQLKVWGNYVYLDTEERRRFAQNGHEYLIEQVQHTGVDTVTPGGTKQVRLSYNHPVKELVWCFPNTSTTNVYHWNTTVYDQTEIFDLESNPSVSAEAGVPQIKLGSELQEDDVGPLDTFKLILNGQDRFKEQGGKYFNVTQPFYHHSGSALPGVYSYSFALQPEEHQPTGTCNFSRIDNAQVEVKMKNSDLNQQMHMFAVNYNVLRIQSGMGGLAFSN